MMVIIAMAASVVKTGTTIIGGYFIPTAEPVMAITTSSDGSTVLIADTKASSRVSKRNLNFEGLALTGLALRVLLDLSSPTSQDFSRLTRTFPDSLRV